jgi:hypothetical protein
LQFQYHSLLDLKQNLSASNFKINFMAKPRKSLRLFWMNLMCKMFGVIKSRAFV